MSQAICQVTSTHMEYSNRLRAADYRRTESEPASRTMHDIRSRFESTSSSEPLSAPEFGLAFGKKSITTTDVTKSPKLTKNYSSDDITKHTSSSKADDTSKNSNKLDKALGRTNKHRGGIVKIQPKDKLVIGSMTSRFINNASLSKQTDSDSDNTLIGLHNAGIVKMNKLNRLSQTTDQAPSWGQGLRKNKSSDCIDQDFEKDSLPSPTTSVPDYVYTSKIDSKLLAAKSFWNKKSQESQESGIPPSISEFGTDYSKGKNSDDKNESSNLTKLCKVDKNSNHEEIGQRFVRMSSVASDDARSIRSTHSLAKSPSQSSVTSSMDGSELEYMNVHNFRVPRRTGSRPPQNIVAQRTQMFQKSVDFQTDDVEPSSKSKDLGTVFKPKGAESHSSGSKHTKSSKVEVVSSPKFKPKHPATLESKEISSTKTALKQVKHSNVVLKPDDKQSQTTNSNDKLNEASKSGKLNLKPQKIDDKQNSATEKFTSKVAGKAKPLPLIPSGKVPKVVDKGRAMFNLIAASNSTDDSSHDEKRSPKCNRDSSKPPPPPPKPPRVFLVKSESSDSLLNDCEFDPVIIPRQAGDGQENDEQATSTSSCQSQKFTNVHASMAESRVYTSATPSEPRPYTCLTINEGSGGDDSLYGSENAYDTLGKSSAASSYDHYDTISQSELDSDYSKPPTLPRRPSNLRHSRPLSAAFSHKDINKPNQSLNNQVSKASMTSSQTIKETSPTSLSPTKIKVPFKLKYLLPKTKRKEEMKKAASVGNLASDPLPADCLYDTVEILPPGTTMPRDDINDVPIDESGYALPEIKGNRKLSDTRFTHDTLSKMPDKGHEKIRLKLNQAFSALRRPATASVHLSDGEEEEKPLDIDVLEQRLRHCNSVKEHAIYASAEQIKGFMTKAYAQLYDYAVVVSLRKNPDSNVQEPFVKFKFPPQVNVEQTTVPQFCYPDAHIWQKCTDYKSEAFSFVLTDVTGTRQYGYCRRLLPPDLNNSARVPEVICVVSPLNATKFYNQLLDEVEKRRMQSSIHAEEFLQAIYGRPMPSPGQSVTIRAMDMEMYESLANVYEEPESLAFTRSPDAQREGIEYDSLLSLLSVSQIVKIFASMLLERKIIFVAEKLSTLSSCVHAFASIIYPFSWQHTFIPLLPPNLIDVVCAPTPFIVGLLSANFHLLSSLDDEMEEVLIVDLDNHKFLQRIGDEKTILPKKLHRALITALDMAKSESGTLRSLMVSEAFLRLFLETAGSFNDFMIHVPGEGRQFQKEEFVSNAANAPSIMVFLQWFTETQMFEVYTTERENDRNIISDYAAIGKRIHNETLVPARLFDHNSRHSQLSFTSISIMLMVKSISLVFIAKTIDCYLASGHKPVPGLPVMWILYDQPNYSRAIRTGDPMLIRFVCSALLGTFEERVFEFKSENHEQFNDNRRFKKFKLFGKKGKK